MKDLFKVGEAVKVIADIRHDDFNLKNKVGIVTGRLFLFKGKPCHSYRVGFEFSPNSIFIRTKNLERVK